MEGPVIVRNTYDLRLSWPDLQDSTGHTLSLDPGEEKMLLVDPGEISHLIVRPVLTVPIPEVDEPQTTPVP